MSINSFRFGFTTLINEHWSIDERTRLIGIVHVSNALGTVNPVAEVCRIAREHGVATLVDGAQATPHVDVDVQALGASAAMEEG